ncbi:hypothetical protein GGR50DRAFT_218041 [Xylaria sp. CBS 124048]|nr:hypothetical protein GGR50DRAFT_218041 [Xylaria sp. CBS 124048]
MLKMDLSFQAIIQHHQAQMESAFNEIVDRLVKHSALVIHLLRLSNLTEDFCNVSIECSILRTGPISASIAPMTLDVHGPAGQFGQITLPPIKTQYRITGVDVLVNSQKLIITDKAALQAFIQGIISGKAVVLSLRNGYTFVTALGINPREINYEKDVEMAGMDGPAVCVYNASTTSNPLRNLASSASMGNMPENNMGLNRSTTASSVASLMGLGSGGSISIRFRVSNPSPLEISFGTCFFEIQDHNGKLVADLKGRLDIRRNYFDITVQGSVNKNVAARLAAEIKEAAAENQNQGDAQADGDAEKKVDKPAPGVRLVGKRCIGAGWCDETVKGINVPLKNTERLFRALGLDDGSERPEDKRKSFTKWASRFVIR